MTDAATKQSLHVTTGSTAGPYIRVSLDQLDDLKRLLDNRHVSYWVGENAISWDGGPYIAVVNLGREGDAAAVQAMLDEG